RELRARLRLAFREDRGREKEHRAIRRLESKPNCHRLACSTHLVAESAIGQHSRAKARVQNRRDSWPNQAQPVVVLYHNGHLLIFTLVRGTRTLPGKGVFLCEDKTLYRRLPAKP